MPGSAAAVLAASDDSTGVVLSRAAFGLPFLCYAPENRFEYPTHTVELVGTSGGETFESRHCRFVARVVPRGQACEDSPGIPRTIDDLPEEVKERLHALLAEAREFGWVAGENVFRVVAFNWSAALSEPSQTSRISDRVCIPTKPIVETFGETPLPRAPHMSRISEPKRERVAVPRLSEPPVEPVLLAPVTPPEIRITRASAAEDARIAALEESLRRRGMIK